MSQAPNASTSFTALEIERIVREVLSSLASEGTSQGISLQSPAKIVSTAVAVKSASVGQVRLSVPVLSLESLRTLSKDTKEIVLSKSVLVTPAAKDFLREKGIAWSISSELDVNATAIANGSEVNSEKKLDDSAPKPLFVTGSVLWLRNLEKQLCPKASFVDQVQIDDAAAVRSVAQAIRAGANSAIAIVKAPHSTLWQAARDEALRPALVSQWSDLMDVLREVPTNMLIVPATRWNIAGAANIARKFLEFIQANR